MAQPFEKTGHQRLSGGAGSPEARLEPLFLVLRRRTRVLPTTTDTAVRCRQEQESDNRRFGSGSNIIRVDYAGEISLPGETEAGRLGGMIVPSRRRQNAGRLSPPNQKVSGCGRPSGGGHRRLKPWLRRRGSGSFLRQERDVYSPTLWRKKAPKWPKRQRNFRLTCNQFACRPAIVALSLISQRSRLV